MSTDRKKKVPVTILLVCISFLAAHLGFRLLPNVFGTWNSQTLDQIFVFRSASEHLRPHYDDAIVYVDLNNSTIQRLNNLYLNRSHFAQVARNLAAMHVSFQVYDFIFAARLHEENDRAFISATAEAGNVYLGLAFELLKEDEPQSGEPEFKEVRRYLQQTKWDVAVDGDLKGFYVGTNPLLTFPELAFASRGLGSISIKFDRDGVLRRVPLLVRYDDAFYPLLPLQVVCDYLGVPPEKILVRPGKHIVLQDAQRPGEGTPHDIVIPIDPSGNMVVNYIGPWERMDHYNFADILSASEDRDELEMWGEELRGKIVVISDVSTGSTDVGPVPTDANFPLSGLHANVVHNILTESFLRELSDWEMLLFETLLLVMVLVLSLRFSSRVFLLGTLAMTASYVGIVMVCFLYGQIMLNAVRPLLMITCAVVSISFYHYIHEEKAKMEGLRQRDFVRATFGRYLSSEVVEELLGSPEGLEMSGEIREVTFMVSDLRGFTSLSSRLAPHEVITMLNRYFERMLDIIARHRGTVNELMGDGILAFFGAPLVASDDPERAVACAIEMQNAMVEINGELRERHLPELSMGIGINTGEVIVGNIGSEKRAKYSAVGTAINTAYRIESFSLGGQVLISPSTYERVCSLVQVQKTQEVEFKGIDYPVTLHDIAGMKGKYQLSITQKPDDLFEKLKPPLPINCFLLDGKRVSETAIPGYIIRLSRSAAEVTLDGQVVVLSNLKIQLAPKDAPGLSGVYGKVLSLDEAKSGLSHGTARLEFTWIPEDAKAFLDQKRR